MNRTAHEQIWRTRLASICSALMLLGITACGGGGGSRDNNVVPNPGGGNNPPAFGLTQRPPLASFGFPDSSGSLGTVTLTNAYPNLNFSAAVFAAPVPSEDRLVVVEQGGRIHAFVDAPATMNTSLVLDLSGTVLFSGEQGLLGLAFDPQFATNRFLYVHYSRAAGGGAPRRSVISRFTWQTNPDEIDAASEKIILENPQPFTNHNGGMLAFGPDNMLYIAFGDGGSGGDPQNNGQDRTTLHGNVLRINVHPANAADAYDVPADNPFVGVAGVLPEIYAYGLRNPFRFSFDSQTGELWLGDVGQGAIEEIDVITAGGNYGWRVFEGTQGFDDTGNSLPPSAFTPPVFEYDHSEGRAVVGGYVYRGTAFSALLGQYVFGDYTSGTIWGLTWNGTSVTDQRTLTSASNPTSFAEKANGELLVVTQSAGLFEFQLSGGSSTDIPSRLSETGLFTDMANLTPATGLIEYGLNHPFWSDGARKRRWLGIPDSAAITFGNDHWAFPAGTVAVKHFEIETPTGLRRLETRVLVRNATEWLGLTYKWNAGGTDADLLLGRELETITISQSGGSTSSQTYEFPSRTDCFACHTNSENALLGVRTPQLNRDFNYPATTDNQLRSLNNINYFSSGINSPDTYTIFPAPDDTQATEANRARAYLDVNCAGCHQPGGPTQSALDFRIDTPDADMNAIGMPPELGDLGLADPRLISPGNKENSVVWARINRRGSAQMPPLGSHVIDAQAVSLVGAWIDNLPPP